MNNQSIANKSTSNAILSLEDMKKIFKNKLEAMQTNHPYFEQVKKFLEKVKVSDTIEWFGTDTYGIQIRVAYKNGLWFTSAYMWNGYNMAYTPWTQYPDIEIKDNYMVKWGWNEFDNPSINNKLKLPT